MSGLRSTLTIRQLSVEDEGSYSCVADGASSSVQLSVEASRTPSDSLCEYEHEYTLFRLLTLTDPHFYSIMQCTCSIQLYIYSVNDLYGYSINVAIT